MLCERLRRLRKFKGVTQSEVARELKITREAYSMYENNKRQMNYESLCILADFFNVTIDYLLGRGEQNLFMLSESEKVMIEKLRKLDERGRETIFTLLDLEYSRLPSQKNIEKEAT